MCWFCVEGINRIRIGGLFRSFVTGCSMIFVRIWSVIGRNRGFIKVRFISGGNGIMFVIDNFRGILIWINFLIGFNIIIFFFYWYRNFLLGYIFIWFWLLFFLFVGSIVFKWMIVFNIGGDFIWIVKGSKRVFFDFGFKRIV